MSVDPLTKKFPWWTPYQFAGNTPIYALDLEGKELMNAYYNYSNDGQKLAIKDPNDQEIANWVDLQIAQMKNDDQALFDYANKYPITITAGNLPQNETSNHNGHIDMVKKGDMTITSYEQAYDYEHGSGAWKVFARDHWTDAKKYKDEFKPVVVKGGFEATITLDKSKIDEVNQNADMHKNGYDLRDKIPDGKVLKHEIGHFLHDSKTDGNSDNKSSEKDAQKIENTFDGKPDTQTDINNYQPYRK